MLSRRQFMRRTSLVSLCPWVPSLFGKIAWAVPPDEDAKTLVVIQLDGGNDGINTVVPFGDDGYGRNRDALRLDVKQLHKLNDHVGLHPQMKAAKELFDDGRFTIVQGVGYPNPDRSHFRSMRIWQTARLDESQHSGYGWLGRALDEEDAEPAAPRAPSRSDSRAPTQPGAIYVGSEEPPFALWGRRSEAITVTSLDDLKLPYSTSQLFSRFDDTTAASESDQSLRLFTTRQMLSAYAAADKFQRQIPTGGDSAARASPSTQLAAHLKLISQFIKSGSGARIFYATQSGYDTHTAQLYTHARLLREFAEALKAFLDDLQAAGLKDRVLVFAFSEFGRRVKENASQGTDHGAAGPVFLAGSAMAGGLIGTTPDLSDLEQGDVKMTTDLREVYTAILDDWLDVNASSVLGGSFVKAPIFQS